MPGCFGPLKGDCPSLWSKNDLEPVLDAADAKVVPNTLWLVEQHNYIRMAACLQQRGRQGMCLQEGLLANLQPLIPVDSAHDATGRWNGSC